MIINEIDSVFQLEESDLFQDSFKFIRQALRPYLKNLFYVPSSARRIGVDVSCIDYEDDTKVVNGVFFEGDNVLYDYFGESYFDPKENHFVEKLSRSKVKEHLSWRMVVPSYRLTVNFLNLDDEAEEVLLPLLEVE